MRPRRTVAGVAKGRKRRSVRVVGSGPNGNDFCFALIGVGFQVLLLDDTNFEFSFIVATEQQHIGNILSILDAVISPSYIDSVTIFYSA